MKKINHNILKTNKRKREMIYEFRRNLTHILLARVPDLICVLGKWGHILDNHETWSMLCEMIFWSKILGLQLFLPRATIVFCWKSTEEASRSIRLLSSFSSANLPNGKENGSRNRGKPSLPISFLYPRPSHSTFLSIFCRCASSLIHCS